MLIYATGDKYDGLNYKIISKINNFIVIIKYIFYFYIGD